MTTIPRTGLGTAWDEYKAALKEAHEAQERADMARGASINAEKAAGEAGRRLFDAEENLRQMARNEAGVS